jgi:hypothetical protein
MPAAKLVLKAKSLRNLYQELRVPYNRLLFRVPATFAGIQVHKSCQLPGSITTSSCSVSKASSNPAAQAAKELEDAGIATHVHMVFR